ncbi:MAG: hypothetical protein ABIH18_06930 [Candidatus Omnitrophota bacterium]
MAKKENWLIFLFFFIIGIFIFKDILSKSMLYRNLMPSADPYAHCYIPLILIKHSFFLWNPYYFCGFPLFADICYCLLSPFTILRVFIQHFFPSFTFIAFNLAYIISYPLCCLFMYLYAKNIGLNKLSAFLSAVIFGIIRRYKIPSVNGYIYIPIILFMFEKSIAEKKINWKYGIITGLLYGILIATSLPQYSYYFSVFFILYFIFRYFSKFKNIPLNMTYLKQSCFLFLTIFLTGISIAAIQLLPTIELTIHSVRFYLKDFNISYSQETLNNLSKIFFSGRKGEMFSFTGIPTIILALTPLLHKNKNKFYYFYLSIAIFFIFISIPSILTRFLYNHLPSFSFFISPIRSTLFFIFSVSIMAGIGLQNIRNKIIKLILFLSVIISIYYAWNIFHSTEFSSLYSKSQSEDSFIFYDDINNLLKDIPDIDKYRVYLDFDEKSIYLLNHIPYFLGGQSDLIPARNIEFSKTSIINIDKIQDNLYYDFLLYPNYLKASNTKYIVLNKTEEEDNENKQILLKIINYYDNNRLFKKIYEDAAIIGYQFRDSMQRAFFVNQVLFIKNKQEILDTFKDKAFNPKETVILEKEISGLSQKDTSLKLESNTQITDYQPGKISISLKTNSRGFLVLSDTYYPGWKTYVNNKQAEIYRANYLFRAIYIDKPGEYTISFIYSPFAFKLGAIISIITLICCIISILYLKNKTKLENKLC